MAAPTVDHAKILELRQSGLSCGAISQQLQCSKATVVRHLKNNGQVSPAAAPTPANSDHLNADHVNGELAVLAALVESRWAALPLLERVRRLLA